MAKNRQPIVPTRVKVRVNSTFVRLIAAGALLPSLHAQTPPPALALPPVNLAIKPTVKKDPSSEWVFSLLPKSLQKNPNLELTVITEMTDEGKKQPPVTPDHPAYYILQSSGHHRLGDSTGEEKIMPQAEVEHTLAKSLAANGYRPAEEAAHPPTLAVFYTWGSHNLLVENDPDNPSQSGQQVARNLLDRAALVGGEKFAKQMLELFNQADALSTAASIPPPPDGEAVLGQAQLDFLNPVNQFRRQSPKNDFLVDQTADDVYYVVASAYDYQSIAEKHRRLLWRTRMTVAAKGVSEEISLPALIANAAPYFGREMDEPDILFKRTVPEGKVQVGTPTVVEMPIAPAKKP